MGRLFLRNVVGVWEQMVLELPIRSEVFVGYWTTNRFVTWKGSIDCSWCRWFIRFIGGSRRRDIDVCEQTHGLRLRLLLEWAC